MRLCVFTESTYTTRDAGEQEFVRFVMRNSAVVMPRTPLVPGRSYRATVAFDDGEVKTWTFLVSVDGRVVLPAGHPDAATPTPGKPLQPVKKR